MLFGGRSGHVDAARRAHIPRVLAEHSSPSLVMARSTIRQKCSCALTERRFTEEVRLDAFLSASVRVSVRVSTMEMFSCFLAAAVMGCGVRCS